LDPIVLMYVQKEPIKTILQRLVRNVKDVNHVLAQVFVLLVILLPSYKETNVFNIVDRVPLLI
jgi:hypothetical protein